MASILLLHVDFAYPSASEDVFRDLSVLVDTGWRTGVVARNGRGKTTLLGLVAGKLPATAGSIDVPVPTRLFPSAPAARGARTLDVVKDAVAPFRDWQRTMERLLADGSAGALTRYADLHERYLALGGYEIDAQIARELDAVGLSEAHLSRPFDALSGGEQTRALVVALFLDPGAYPLIDEPTNHLDRHGREALMGYLAAKPGFLLVSHDRRFLDGAVDHVLSINAGDVRINEGNYTQWRTHMNEELEAEGRQRRQIERDVARLEHAARDTRTHAHRREAGKYGAGPVDRGFIGRRAAKQMKRARHVERRIEAQIETKRGLLKNAEKARRLKVETAQGRQGALLTVQNLGVAAAGCSLFRNLSFTIRRGERIAVTGRNGCGKTTLLDIVCGERSADTGLVRRPAHVTLARAYQHPFWDRGRLGGHLQAAGLDETRFRQLMGVVGVGAEVFDRDLASYSLGQLKKVDLCRSMVTPADMLVWDEPLNWIDVHSREQIEASILEDAPTLLFVEHDQAFIDRVATGVIDLDQG